MSNELNGVTPLAHLGVLRAQGVDAASFLHNQLSNDFLLLDEASARLAGFCNAKGRLQASFIGFKRGPEDVLLLCSEDLLARTLKRLSMFVLRAKVKVSDASAEFTVWGLAGEAVAQHGGSHAAKPWSRVETAAGSLITLYPSDGTPRALLVTSAETKLTPAPGLTQALWDWSEVRAGVATVTQAIFEAFVPQMLNHESVGGVNFKKGCYPGQEVVARSQFRGTLKRRAYLAHAEVQMLAGEDVFLAADDQPCGTVAQAAKSPAGGYDAIVSMQTSAFDHAQVHLGHGQGAVLSLEAPPYPLLADI